MSAIRISKALAKAAKGEAALMCRSVAAQIEHWASIGRAIEARMSTLEIKGLLAGAVVPEHAAGRIEIRDAVDGPALYRMRIREGDPMLDMIARAGDAGVTRASQAELHNAKLARQRLDYSAQRERILGWKALSPFAGAKIKAWFREVPLEK